jgi:Domain of unknown function (DUF4349)
MKSPDRTDETLDPEIERQLAAIDRALAGEPVEPGLADLATLTADLRAERAAPPERWALEMDAKARAGFGRSRLRPLRHLLPDRPRRLLLPAGALATALVVLGVGIGSLGDGGTDQNLEPTPATSEQPAAPPIRQNGGAKAAEELGRASGAAADEVATAPPLPGNDRTAPGKAKRRQDRNAFLALKTGTDEVRDVSDEAIQITESAGGVVLSSQLSETEARSTASLELSIPTRELDPTLDRLTDLATVQTLNETAVDITRPFVSAQDELRDARAERRQLLRALGNASTEAEADALRKQLRDARRRISRAEAAFDNIARRARTSRISMTIEGTPGGAAEDGWTLGDAADDALAVLKAVAGVLLISAAILAPLALLAGAAYAIAVGVRRRRRNRTLDEG